MSVKIRLKRIGSKKVPYYRIVVADSRYPRDGRFIEEIGIYDPLKEPSEIKVKKERVEFWKEKGAKPTQVLEKLFKKNNIWKNIDV